LRQQAREFSRQYQIPEDVAFQIVRGDFTFKDWMERHQVAMEKRDKRQVIEHERKVLRARNEGMARQYFLKQKKNKEPMVFVRADGTELEGPVTGILPYHFYVGDGPEQQQYEKLSMLYCYKKEHEDELKTVLAPRDPAVHQMGLEPSRDRTVRYQVPEAELKACTDGKRKVVFVMQNGQTLSGTVDWYSKFNVKLRLAQDASVVLFTHAVHAFRATR
jgi:sRNA-binding regulator protein Hfq